MNKLMLSVCTIVALWGGAGIVGAADPMTDKETKPTLGERFTKETVKGTLMKMEGNIIRSRILPAKKSGCMSMPARNSIKSGLAIK